MSKIYEVAILGGGAAGLFTAGCLSENNVSCIVVEGNSGLGKKILISGGGKCNFTNIEVSAKNFRSSNHHFSKSALAKYSSQQFIDDVIEGKIEYFEKKLGQLFAKTSARDILKGLEKRCSSSKVDFSLSTPIDSVSWADEDKVFSVKIKKTASNVNTDSTLETILAKKIIVATGGLSIPNIGATDIGYKIAKSFGHKVTPLLPALDGFVFSEEIKKVWTELSGVSLDVIIKSGKQSFRENILFTHSGLSGPASLQASLYWDMNKPIRINLLPDRDIKEELLENQTTNPDSTLLDLIKHSWTKRFLQIFTEKQPKIKKYLKVPLHSLNSKALELISSEIHDWHIIPARTMGYQKAEVTRGGVNVDELSSKTMESKIQEGLYFIGEVVDVTGWLGGFNFQWAWSSGWSAAQDISSKLQG